MKSSSGKFSTLLTERKKKELGPVNLNWFSQLSKKDDGNTPARNQNGQHSFVSPKVIGNLSKQHGVTPSLLSPNEPKSANLGPGLIARSTPLEKCAKKGIRSPSTPGSYADTPTEAHFTTTINDSSPGLTPLISSQHMFTKHTFKTPASTGRSHSKSLAISLGVNLNESNASWTSSLVTPNNRHGSIQKNLDIVEGRSDDETYMLGAARALFTPGHDSGNSSQEEMATGLNSTIETESDGESSDSMRKLSKSKKKSTQKEKHTLCVKSSNSADGSERKSLKDDSEEIKILSQKVFSEKSNKDPQIVNIVNSPIETTSIDDVLSVFVSPPSQSSIRRKTVPRRTKRSASQDNIWASPVSCQTECKKARLSGKNEVEIAVIKGKFVKSQHDSLENSDASFNEIYKENESCVAVQSIPSENRHKIAEIRKDEMYDLVKNLNKVENVDHVKTSKSSTHRSMPSLGTTVKEFKEKKKSQEITSNISDKRTLKDDLHPYPMKEEYSKVQEETKCFNNENENTDIKVTKDGSCDAGLISLVNIVYKNKEIVYPKEEFFTQISPSALKAMYSAADLPLKDNEIDMTELELQKDKIGVKHTSEIHPICRESSSQESTPVHLTNLNEKSIKRESKVHGVNNKQFNESSATPLKWKNTIDSVTESKTPLLNVKAPKPLSLKNRKTKRFSYPTSSQIVDVCPRKVFNFNVEKNLEDVQDESLKKENKATTDEIQEEQTTSNAVSTDMAQAGQAKKVSDQQTYSGDNKNLSSERKPDEGKESLANYTKEGKDHKRFLQTRFSSGFTTITNYKESADNITTHPQEKSILRNTAISQFSTDTHQRILNDEKVVSSMIHNKTDNTPKTSMKERSEKSHPQPMDNYNSLAAVRTSTPTEQSGFSSASGNAIYLNENALEIAKKLVQNVDNQNENEPDTLKQYGCVNKSETGENNQLNVSKLNDFSSNKKCNFSKDVLSENTSNWDDSLKKCDNKFLGFSCASGKSITVSEKAKQRANALMKEITDDDPEMKLTDNLLDESSHSKEKYVDITEGASMSITATNFRGLNVGFKCASGKSIEVSDTALKKATTLMQCIENEDHENFENKGHSAKDTSGFHLASGKSLSISESSMQRAHKLMQQVTADIQPNPLAIDHNLDNLENTIREVRRNPGTVRLGASSGNVPQGFRPFKPPRLSKPSQKGAVKEIISTENHSECQQNKSPLLESPEQQLNNKVKRLDKSYSELAGDKANNEIDCNTTENEADEFTFTQKMEISESTAAFLEMDPQTQFAFTQVHCSNENDSSKADSVIIVKGNKEDSSEDGLTDIAGYKERSIVKSNEGYDNNISKGLIVNAELDSAKNSKNVGSKTGCQNKLNFYSEQKPNSDLKNATSGSFIQNVETLCRGFCTAGGKPVSVSASSFKQAQSLFLDLAEEFESGETAGKSKAETEEGTVANESKTDKHWRGIKGKDISNNDSGFVELNSTTFQSSSSANYVHVPKDINLTAIDETANDCYSFFDDTLLETDAGKDIICQSGFSLQDKTNHCLVDKLCKHKGGTSPLAGKNSPNEEYTETTNNKSESEPTNLANVKPYQSRSCDIEINTNFQQHAFVGFQTASGNQVKISEKSLKVARTFIEKDSESLSKIRDQTLDLATNVEFLGDYEQNVGVLHPQPQENISQFEGFQTPSGERISVSDKSLNVTKAIDKDVSEECPLIAAAACATSRESDAFDGFQTTRGKSKTVCDLNLNVAKPLLKDNEVSFKSDSFVGFQTAGGKSVSVSDKSINAAKALLKENGLKFDRSSIAECQSDERKALLIEKNLPVKTNSIDSNATSNKYFTIADKSQKTAKSSFLHDEFCSADSVVGFQTAGGKSVKISEKSLNAAKTLLNEINVIPDNFAGFQTAGGKSVQVSEKSLNIAKALLQDDEESFKRDPFVGSQKAGGKSVKVSAAKGLIQDYEVSFNPDSFAGFQTARGKSVKVSEKSLNAAKALIEDSFAGVQTARGKSVTISDRSFDAAKALLQDNEVSIKKDSFSGFQTAEDKSMIVSDKSNAKSFLQDNEVSFETELFAGFQTAGGNSVKVSDKGLNAAKALLQNKEVNFNQDSLAGFQTAGGKSVTVSEKNLNAAKTFLQENEMGFKTNSFDGLQTAGGKSVKVSDKSLNAAKTLLQDTEMSFKPESFAGFQTAGGKLVKVSEKNLNAAKAFLQDPETNFQTDSFAGFQTAGGKSVQVSDKSLLAAKILLETNEENNGKSPSAATFQSAIRDTVNISQESSEVVRTLHQENTTGSKTESISHCDGAFAGFQTAKGTKVEITEKALLAAKSYLEDAHCVPNVPSPLLPDRLKENIQPVKITLNNSTYDNSKSGGFRTAKGDGVTISDKSLKVAKLKLHEDIAKSLTGKEQLNVSDKWSDEQTSKFHNVAGQRNHRLAAENQRVSLSQDTDDGIQALLADGDFEDCFSLLNDCNSSVSGAKPWMKSVNSTPEGFMTDRKLSSDTLPIKSLVTAPQQDVKKTPKSGETYRWQGQTTYRPLHRKNTLNDRNTFIIRHPSNPARMKHRMTPSHAKQTLQYSSINGVNKSPWKTPGKSTNSGGTFNTSIKSVSSFKTPVKKTQETSSFVTPVKKLPEQSSFITPVKPPADRDSHVTAQGITTAASEAQEGNDPDAHHIDSETLQQLMKDDFESEVDEASSSLLAQTKIEATDEVKKKRLKARVTQAQEIKQKKSRGDTKPCMGKMFREKMNYKQATVRDVVGNNLPRMYSDHQLYSLGVRKSTLAVTSKTAMDFRFNVRDYFGEQTAHSAEGVQIGDGAFAVMDEYSTIGKEEICNGFFAMKGVEPKLVNREWMYNHYRWIVWKLASYETRLPSAFAGRCLIPDQVMLQLKYRYDREVDRSHRSALKKIYEKDDSPQKCMVLCVSDVLPALTANSDQKAVCVIELTDGWYPIKAAVDGQLSQLLFKNKLRVGDKIIVYGAERMGCQDGCLPLEAPPDVMLKIHANSTRRVKWSTKLGYCRNPQPLPLALSSLYPNGGLVGCLDVIITRVYPLQYLEKQADGSNVFRCARAEERTAKIFERDRQRHLETTFAKLQENYEKKTLENAKKTNESIKKWSSKDVAGLQTSKSLLEAYQTAADPSYLQSLLSSKQETLLHEARSQAQADEQAEMQSELQKQFMEMQQEVPVRNVTPLLKVRIVGCNNYDIDSKAGSILTIWRPKEDVIALFKEGHRLKIYNLTTGEPRGKVQITGTCKVSLTGTRTTRFQAIEVDDNFLDLLFEPREVVKLSELRCARFQPPYGEVDIVGVVIQISQPNAIDKTSGGEGFIQTVYLADMQNNAVGIKFWGKLSSYCLEELLTIGTCVACTNLIWKPVPWNSLPSVTASDMSVFTTNPRQKYLKEELDHIEKSLKASHNFVTEMQSNLEDRFNGIKHSSESGLSGIVYTKQPALNSQFVTESVQIVIDSHKRDNTVSDKPRQMNTRKVIESTTASDTLKTSRIAVNSVSSQNLSNTPINMETPKSRTNTDPLLNKHSSIQKSKAAKLDLYMHNLEQMASPVSMSISSLVSPLPEAGCLKKPFKAPGLRRSSMGKKTAFTSKLVVSEEERCEEKSNVQASHNEKQISSISIAKNSSFVDLNISTMEVEKNFDTEKSVICQQNNLVTDVIPGQTVYNVSSPVDSNNENPNKLMAEANAESTNVCSLRSDTADTVANVEHISTNKSRKRKKSDQEKSFNQNEAVSKRRKSLRLSRTGR